MRKNIKIVNIIIFLVLILFTVSFATESMPLLEASVPLVPVVSKWEAMLLVSIKFLIFIIPALFFIIMILLNKKKDFKKIIIYLVISIVMVLTFYVIGHWICDSIKSYDVKRENMGFIEYYDTVIYYNK